jgi:glycosyltransferase involved in cell wall biosynthesis
LERANGVQIVKTAAALARRGVPTTMLVRRSDPRSTEQILGLFGVTSSPSLTIRRLAVAHGRGAFGLSRALFLLQSCAHALRALSAGRIVYTRDLQLADLLLGVTRATRRLLVFEAHAVEAIMYQERHHLYATCGVPHDYKARRIERRERRVWRRAGGIVTTTRGIRDTFARFYGERGSVAVIPNGCDVPSDRAFPGLSAEIPPLVLYAGQLYPWKGVDVLVQAMVRVPSARLLILGGLPGEPDMGRIRTLIEASGLGDRAELYGTVPQTRVAAALAHASVVAVPFLRTAMTEAHTSPIKAFEAMAAGRPIVCSDTQSSREFLRHEENALLVPPGDAEALGGAIARLLANRALAERLARTAFSEAYQYSWDARAERLASFCKVLS